MVKNSIKKILFPFVMKLCNMFHVKRGHCPTSISLYKLNAKFYECILMEMFSTLAVLNFLTIFLMRIIFINVYYEKL